MRRVHSHTTRVLGTLVAVLGVVMIVSTIVRGGGPLSLGVVLGAGLTAFGAARLYLTTLDDRP